RTGVRELGRGGGALGALRALSAAGYCQPRLHQRACHDLTVMVLSNHRVGQAVCAPIDGRHQALLPDYVWGDGNPAGVQQRAAEEMLATLRAAEKLGVGVVSGFSGSPVWSYVAGYPPATPEVIAEAFQDFARKVGPLLP